MPTHDGPSPEEHVAAPDQGDRSAEAAPVQPDVTGVSRRRFLAASGAVSAVAGGAGLGLFGYAAGQDPASYLGYQDAQGASQYFDRERFAVDKPRYEIVGPTNRPDARVLQIFERRGRFMRQARRVFEEGGEFDEPLKSYYEQYPEELELDRINAQELRPKLMADAEEYEGQFLLVNAWSDAMGAVYPDPIEGPPDVNDFPRPDYMGNVPRRRQMKAPGQTAKLVKKVARELGSTLVGITELNPDWVYAYPVSRRGFEDPDAPIEIPDHWKYAIVVGAPMSWDPLFSNPNYGTSNDAYSRSRIIAARLAAFIHALGYPARTNTPGTSYDLMVPPIAIDAGLGEQGRHSIMITPELGSNFRPAVVITDLPMATDKPIDFGVQDFCKHCKLCAENCPSDALSFGDKVEVRGYRRYAVNTAKCQNFWTSNLGPMGCRICVACCPYTRRANWLHRGALKVTANDPTGLSERALTGLQKALYDGPDPTQYYMPSLGGENASYRQPPWWLRSEDFIDD